LKNNQFFRKLYFSYIIFIVAAILFFGYLSYFNIAESSYSTDMEYGQNTLEYSMDNIDIFLNQMDNFLLQISLDNDIDDLVTDPPMSSEYYKITVIKKLTNIVATNSKILSVYLTDMNNYVFSSPGGFSTFSDFNDKSWSKGLEESSLTLTDWKVRTISNGYLENDTQGKTTVITKVARLSNRRGYFVLNINVNSLYGNMTVLQGISSPLNIIDSSGKTIVNNRNSIFNGRENAADFLDKLLKETGNLGKGHETVTYNGIKHVVSYVQSPMTKWIYIKAVPLDTLYERANKVRSLALTASVVFFLTGLVFSYALSFNLYKPIKSLRNNVALLFKDGATTKDEFMYIHNAVDTLINDKRNTEYKLQQNYVLIKEKILMELLEGNIKENKELYEEFADLDQSNSCYIICSARFHPNNPEALACISRYCKENLSGNGIYKKIENTIINENLIILLQVERNNLNHQSLNEFLSSLIRISYEDYMLSCTIGAGCTADTYAGIHSSYVQSLEALSYSLVEGRDKIYYYEDFKTISNSKNIPLYINHADENTILKNINEKNIQNIIDGFQAAIKPLTPKECFSKNGIYNMYNEYIVIIFKYILNNNIKTDVNINISELMDVSTVVEMAAVIERLCGYITAQLSGNDNAKIINNIAEYIEKNYMEEITLEGMAEKVYLSKSHLSRLFKQYYGKNFNNYLITKRMDIAEQMLIDTNLQINQISSKVGYCNLNSFTKTFKEYKGISPCEYRKQNSLERFKCGPLEITEKV
jgi:two-component system, response regulator YesN